MDRQNEITAVWENNADEQYRRDQSHWRGHGRWDDERWTNLGDAISARLVDLSRIHGRRPLRDGFGDVLEWGPGGGANLVGVAPHSSILFGVDISQKNLDEAGRQVRLSGHDAFVPVLLDEDPSIVKQRVGQRIDLFFSSTVFQHFPSKEYGREVLRSAFDLLNPGGLGYIQIRYDDGNPKYEPKDLESYRTSHLYATSYGIAEFWVELQMAGFRPAKVANINPDVNYAAFYFAKPEASPSG
jgi:SAM-dependent methyltransferase